MTINLYTMKQARAETIIVESDLVAKAILDLIPTLGITKLVVGTTKSSLRYVYQSQPDCLIQFYI